MKVAFLLCLTAVAAADKITTLMAISKLSDEPTDTCFGIGDSIRRALALNGINRLTQILGKVVQVSVSRNKTNSSEIDEFTAWLKLMSDNVANSRNAKDCYVTLLDWAFDRFLVEP